MSAVTREVIYLAIGEPVWREVIASARSMQRWAPDLPIAVVTDVDADEENLFSRVVRVRALSPGRYGSRVYKTDLPRFTDADQSLFLDSDTRVVSDPGEIWSALESADMAMARHLGRVGYSGYNSGVMAWRRSDAAAELFREWHSAWCLRPLEDQPALAEALNRTALRVAELPQRMRRAVIGHILLGVAHGR